VPQTMSFKTGDKVKFTVDGFHPYAIYNGTIGTILKVVEHYDWPNSYAIKWDNPNLDDEYNNDGLIEYQYRKIIRLHQTKDNEIKCRKS
jgi:hypothetical protein